jgi:hypothetical protein
MHSLYSLFGEADKHHHTRMSVNFNKIEKFVEWVPLVRFPIAVCFDLLS